MTTELPPPPPDAWDRLKGRINSRGKTIRYEISRGDTELQKFSYVPQHIKLIGAVSGRGKSVFGLQTLCGAIRIAPYPKAVILNTEMPEETVWERMIAHLAQVPLGDLQEGTYMEEEKRNIADAMETIENWIKPRLLMLGPSCTIEDAIAEGTKFGAQIAQFDRVQKVATAKSFPDNRQRMDYLLGKIRDYANTQHVAVLEVSEVNRPTRHGAVVDNDNLLNRYSFKESQEFLYHADQCFILRQPPKLPALRILDDVKIRNGKGGTSIRLEFDEDVMTFRGAA